MKTAGLVVIVSLTAAAALAAALLVDWNPARSEREAFIQRCNEEGAGGMFTSREYCEALYAKRRKDAAVRP